MGRHEIGVDLVDIDRIQAVLDRFPNRFRDRVLTEAEARYVRPQGRAHRRPLGGQGGDQQGAGPGRARRRLAGDRGPAQLGRRSAGAPARSRRGAGGCARSGGRDRLDLARAPHGGGGGGRPSRESAESMAEVTPLSQQWVADRLPPRDVRCAQGHASGGCWSWPARWSTRARRCSPGWARPGPVPAWCAWQPRNRLARQLLGHRAGADRHAAGRGGARPDRAGRLAAGGDRGGRLRRARGGSRPRPPALHPAAGARLPGGAATAGRRRRGCAERAGHRGGLVAVALRPGGAHPAPGRVRPPAASNRAEVSLADDDAARAEAAAAAAVQLAARWWC